MKSSVFSPSNLILRMDLTYMDLSYMNLFLNYARKGTQET